MAAEHEELADLVELAEIRAARVRLDGRELVLIERARYTGATWAQIATALGLSSRQAAEQRRQRLAATARARHREADQHLAPGIVPLRSAVSQLQSWIDTDRRWDSRFTRAALVRSTVAAALPAPPGALYALAGHLLDDLTEVDVQQLPQPVKAAVDLLRKATSTHH